jgi:hypothetical protein
MNDLSPETNQLLELARGAGGLNDERRSQLKTGLLTQIAAIGLVGATSAGAGATVVAGAGVAAGAGAGAASAGVTAGKVAWLSSSLLKAVSALTLLSVTGVGVYALARSPHTAEPAHTAPSATAELVASRPASAPLVPAAPSAVEAPAAPPVLDPAGEKSASPRVVSAAQASAPLSAETLAEETRLLREADQALRAGNAPRALTLLDEHASRYPRGALAPERNAERLIARCKLGQVEAKSAQAYLSTHANSAFAPRIRDACGLASR